MGLADIYLDNNGYLGLLNNMKELFQHNEAEKEMTRVGY
jgi:hypothetical protein